MPNYNLNSKEKRANEAREHSALMLNRYSENIYKSISDTKIYEGDFRVSDETATTNISVVAMDTVSAVFVCHEGKTAVLNFASFKHPGGAFINGAKAQEESLCHESTLYEVLVAFNQTFYAENENHLNNSLYQDRLLYSPDIVFHRYGKETEADVITCAAPNKAAAQKYHGISDDCNTEALRSRINLILQSAFTEGVNTLILGAFGCGVFGQDAREVALTFKEGLSHTYFDKVVFAVPNTPDSYNFEQFHSVFAEG